MLRARDEKKDLEAVQKLKESGLNNVLFHQLDVADPDTIQRLADFSQVNLGSLIFWLTMLGFLEVLPMILVLLLLQWGYAVVTGANKGIGFEICRQLASNGFTVVLTARDGKRGLLAVQKLKESGLNNVVFHQLDVADPDTIQPLADFLTCQFGKLDILVNNAGVLGAFTDDFKAIESDVMNGTSWTKVMTQTYNLAVECLETNYYGAKRMCEALIPLLQLSDSPRIVSVSSGLGVLKNINNEWAKAVLNDVENLTEQKIDEVLNEYLKDFKEGSSDAKGWSVGMSAYILSKAAMNAYTRILAKKLPNFCINSVCPGYVKTDINHNTGYLTAEEGAESVVKLALLPNGGPSGLFFQRQEISPF